MSEQANLQLFNFKGTDVRVTIDQAGEPWFVAKDVSEILGYSETNRMTARLDSDDCSKRQSTDSVGRRTELTIINESGLYSAILGSSKPEAKAFKRWVTHEVLPSIRKTGGYIYTTPEDTEMEIMAKGYVVAMATIERQKQRLLETQKALKETSEALEEAKPKAEFFDQFTVTNGTVLVRDFAKHIAQALGVRGFGQRVMFEWLKNNGYLNENRYPSQRSVDLGVLKAFESYHQHRDGSLEAHHCSRITCKGQQYFYEKIKDQYQKQGCWW